jgi:opacity protein-like surface antigen
MNRILSCFTFALIALLVFVRPAMAQNTPAPAASDDCWCWIDTKTGKGVASFPVITDPNGEPGKKTDWIRPSADDPNRAFDPRTGRNFYRDPDGCWKDSKTGKSVPSFPVITDPNGEPGKKTDWIRPSAEDPNRAFDPRTGRNFARVPCPPPTTTTPPPPTTPKTNDVVKTASAPARFELGLGYSYMHPDAEVVKDLNGFNVSGFYNVNSWLAFGGEFSGLYGTATETRQFMVGDMKKDFDVKTSLDRYLYLFGPQVMWHPCEHAKVFGHVLVGGVHDRNEVSFPDGSMRSSADAFALAVGVGVDVQVTRHFSVGPSFDYVPTHFTSPTGDNWQNNWRVGVVGKISF